MTVADTGTGISDEIMNHIFEPFFTTKPAGHGTGLGLAMVYGIIRQHEGAIRVESTPGIGSTFTIYLREAEGSLLPDTLDSVNSPVMSASVKILVVEDNEMVRDMVVHILRAEGHQVVETESVDHALTLVTDAGTSFDLLVSDVIMPGMNGPAMYLKMQVKLPGLQALFISGYSNDPAFMDAVDSEAVQFLQKPFSVDELLNKVRDSLN
jgi:CheY-like chemotaxis protein